MNVVTYPPGCKDIQVELANDELIRRLKKIQSCFQNLDQTANEKYKELSMFLGSDFFLQHEHEDVQLLVACCLADIFRVYAPDSPFQDPNNLKNIFNFLANQLRGLKDYSNTSFRRYFYLLENLECVKTFLLCQELDDSQEIISNLFENVFKIINEKTMPKVKTLLYEMLHPLLNEPDQISTRVLDILFSRIIEPAKSNNKDTYTLAVNLLKKGNQHFEYLVQNHLNSILLTSRSSMSHNLTISNAVSSSHSLNINSVSNNISIGSSNSSNESIILNNSLQNLAGQSSEAAAAAGVHGLSSNQFISDKLCLIIYELNEIRPALLDLVMPQLEYKLKSNELKERREYTRLLSKMFSEKESKLAKQVPQLWEAYLERFADMNEDIRKICIQHICDFLVQNACSIKSIVNAGGTTMTTMLNQEKANENDSKDHSSSQILEQVIEQVKNRSLDPDESLRFEVVQEILKAIKIESNLITIELLNILKERTLDIKIRIRKLALQGLATLYKKIHAKSNSRKTVQLLNWIPSKIMKIYFQDSIEDKLIVERLLNSSIVPYSLGPIEKMAQLYYAFCTFDDYSILSLVEIMRNRVNLYQLMRSIIELNELSADKRTPDIEAKLDAEIIQVSHNLLDAAKGAEFMKTLLNLFKTNLNLKNYFKSFINLSLTCNKSMHFIQLILTNFNNLNQTQMSMGRRLIERMSSLIIDKECLECLIELVEYKIKQKLTPEQRRMLKKKMKKVEPTIKAKINKSKRGRKAVESSDEDNLDDDEDENESGTEANVAEENSEDDLRNENDECNYDEEEAEDDDNTTKTTETSNREFLENDKILLKHIDDDGEKGLKLISTILMIHTNYGFANPTTYQKLFLFVNSRKDHVVSSTLKILSQFFSASVRATYSKEQHDAFDKINNQYLEKLKYFSKNGKPKQAKYSIHLINNNFEKSLAEKILYELYTDLFNEANLKQAKTFITCLISLGHICFLIPKLVGKEIKDFISKTIAKDILLAPMSIPLNISLGEASFMHTLSKRKNNLKLAGKWCENQEELPFNTRTRIQAIKLITRWCLGLKSECTTIIPTLKILTKLIKDNTNEQSGLYSSLTENQAELNDTKQIQISEAEKSRIRSVCGNQLLKLAQETSFKPLITAEYFHTLAKLMTDPVTNIRDILIKKLQKGLQCNKLPIYYMSIFCLLGFDHNRERKAKVKKIYSAMIKKIRLNDSKNNQKQLDNNIQRMRILPEMCLPYAVSLIAHNIQIDSLKDEVKIKQIKECMSVILDPLIENPDGYQIAYIKKVLNKIKTCDDGLAVMAKASNNSKLALQNIYNLNKKLCMICEIFLFHLHSKSFTYLTTKEFEFDVKLPNGFYVPKENNQFDELKDKEDKEEEDEEDEEEKKKTKSNNDKKETLKPETELEKENLNVAKKQSCSKIVITKKRKATEISPSSSSSVPNKNLKTANNQSDSDSAEDNITLGSLKAKLNSNSPIVNKQIELKDTSLEEPKNNTESPKSLNSPPLSKRSKQNTNQKNADTLLKSSAKTKEEESKVVNSRRSTRLTRNAIVSPTSSTSSVEDKSGKKNTRNSKTLKNNLVEEENEEQQKNDEVVKEQEEKEQENDDSEADEEKIEKNTKAKSVRKPAVKKAMKKTQEEESNSSYTLRQKRTKK